MTFRRKSISRRDFIKYSMAAGAAASLPFQRAFVPKAQGAVAAVGPYGLVSPQLTKFKDLIRGIGTDIPLAASDGSVYWKNGKPFQGPVANADAIATHYTIDIGEYRDVLHSELAPYGGTRLRGFGQGGTFKHLGEVIVAQKNTPVQITFNNLLTQNQAVANDPTLPMPAGNRWDRTAIHIHGGFVPWISDGGPFDWWAPDGSAGTSFLNNAVLNPGAAPNQAEYYYPNNQTGRLVWYHDHAWGVTRTNAYSGIASGYVIADPVGEAAFDAANTGVPSALNLGAINSTFFYLVFQDKMFIPPGGPPKDYPAIFDLRTGDLFYAYFYNTAFYGPQGAPSFGGALLPLPVPSCVPEFFGDTMLVNGTAYPTLEVEARPVRIRMLNACNARFLNPRLVGTAGTTFPNNAEPNIKVNGPSFIQIGTEGGYLPAATPVAGPKFPQLLMAPAERADLVVDFTGIAAGTEFLLYNDAPGPFPGGASVFDNYPGNPKTPWSLPGFGPNTRTLMKFKVKAPSGTVTPLPATINTAIAGLNDPLLVAQTPGVPNPIPTSVMVNGSAVPVSAVRTLTLSEGFDQYGRLQQFLGNNLQASGSVAGFFGRPYVDPPTEVIPAGSVEVWQLINTTADTHPIHFHLVNVQILYRQPVKTKGFTGTITVVPQGPAVAPDFNELGYKETVRMNPGTVTTVIMKFDLPAVPFTVPASPRTGGNEYVFHCHILEHEEHDMMRPVVVI